MSDTPEGIIPGDREDARPGEYRLPAADFVTHTVVWVILLVGVLVSAYVIMGTVDQSGLIALDRDAVSGRMATWLVPAAAGMALLRVLGLARVVDWLAVLPMTLFVGVCIMAWVLLAPAAGVLLLLHMVGVDALGAAQPILLVCQAIGVWWAVYYWLASQPSGARNPAAEGPQDPAGGQETHSGAPVQAVDRRHGT